MYLQINQGIEIEDKRIVATFERSRVEVERDLKFTKNLEG